MAADYLSNELCASQDVCLVNINDNVLPVVNGSKVTVLELNDQDVAVNLDSRLQSCYLQLTSEKYSTTQICRLCACTVNNAFDVFNCNDFQESLAIRINKYLPIVVCETDPFPKSVCKECVEKLNHFHDLVEKSVIVEEHFRKVYMFDSRYFELTEKTDMQILKTGTEEFNVASLSYMDTLADIGEPLTDKSSKDMHKTTELLYSVEPALSLTMSDTYQTPKMDAADTKIIVTARRGEKQVKNDFNCRFCNENIANVQVCLEHCCLHEDNCQYFVCALCEYLLTSKSERDIHVQAHFMEGVDENLFSKTTRSVHKGFNCKKCKVHIDTIESAVDHTVKHKPATVKTFSCILCVKRLTLSKLHDHLKNHFPINSKAMYCNTCNNLYFDEKTLKEHRCRNVRKYRCSLCKMSFQSQLRLNFHKDFHQNKSTYCNICKKDFKFESKIYSHIAGVHNRSREKPYCCDICGKTFMWLTILWDHQRTHTNERPFQCSKCDARFCNKYTLRGHMATHQENPEFFCDKCEYRTGRKSSLHKHMTRFHKEVTDSQNCVNCNICKEAFPNKHHAQVEGHENMHPGIATVDYDEVIVTKLYTCERCERSFLTLDSLTEHRSVHVSDDAFYQCRLCEAGFEKHDLLTRHQKVHTDIISLYDSKLSVLQVIVCDICFLECLDYRQLLNHKERNFCSDKKRSSNSCQVLITKHLQPLKIHQLYINANGLFECPTCQKMYKNRRRYRLHLASHVMTPG